MKKSEWEKLKTKPRADLEKEVKTQKENLWSLRVDLAAGKVKNVREINNTKKTIARIYGILNDKKIT